MVLNILTIGVFGESPAFVAYQKDVPTRERGTPLMRRVNHPTIIMNKKPAVAGISVACQPTSGYPNRKKRALIPRNLF